MKKIIMVLVSLMLVLVSASAFAATRGLTNKSSSCTVNIVQDWMRRGGKVQVSILDGRGYNVGGAAYVYIYDEVNTLMKKQYVSGRTTLNLPWTRHRFYTLKFENAYPRNNSKFFKSTSWRVNTISGGNARIQ